MCGSFANKATHARDRSRRTRAATRMRVTGASTAARPAGRRHVVPRRTPLPARLLEVASEIGNVAAVHLRGGLDDRPAGLFRDRAQARLGEADHRGRLGDVEPFALLREALDRRGLSSSRETRLLAYSTSCSRHQRGVARVTKAGSGKSLRRLLASSAPRLRRSSSHTSASP